MQQTTGLRERLLFYALVPAIVAAVLLLGGTALRTTLQIEKARQQTIFDATLTLADERVDRLDKLIVAEDNVAGAHVDLARLTGIAERWLPTAARETPTIRAILVLDMDHPEHEVLAFASRTVASPSNTANVDDETFRRLLVTRFVHKLNYAGDVSELRHLHDVLGDQSFLLSYWQRVHRSRTYLVVAWHEVPSLVHDIMPRLYRDLDRGGSRMNVVDEDGRIVFGPPITGGEFTVGRPFPTTLYNWRLQVALTQAEELGRKVESQRLIEIAMVLVAAVVAIAGLAIVLVGSARVRRLAALKSDFVANVSHELKTPLSLVRMFGELLLSERVPTEEKKRQYLAIIVSESERLTALIENVLDFAKVERGKSAYDFAPGSVPEVVRAAVDAYRYRAERELVEVRFTAKEGLPAVRMDARAVELAVINLLDNALKYAKDGGQVDVDVDGDARAVTIRVADLGPGIEPDEQATIFERFVRGKRAGQTKVRGSGIGLALVKHIADSHGGRVEVRSPITEDGRGTAFVVRLPALRGAEAALPTTTAAPAE